METRLEACQRELTSLERDARDGLPVETEALAALRGQIAQLQDGAASLKTRWETERAAVEAVWKARAELATAAAQGGDPGALRAALEAADKHLAQVRGKEPLVHADVDADVVARVIASWTGIPAGKMTTDSIANVLSLDGKLRERVRGQDAAVSTLAEVVRIANAGIRNPDAPIGVLLFVGPSGVGKTETATALADTLYGGERFMTVINMSEFQEKHTVSRLIGSPPGYVGYGEGGVLTEAIRQRPYSVVLLDEVEKADLEVMNLFYQVFDKGTLSDGEGRLIDCKNCVFILTSNLATDLVVKAYERDEPPSTEEVIAQIRPALSKHFKPALLARMTVVPFAPIGRAVMREIAEQKLGKILARLRTAHRIETVVDPELVSAIAKRCTESETGARNVDHILRGTLVPQVSTLLLERLAAGEQPRRLDLGLTPTGEFRIEFGA
jgi:type VI secretion system protein VasG